jgi:hypothetical protein
MDNIPVEKEQVNIHVSQAYLELARVNVYELLVENEGLKSLTTSEINTMVYSLNSVAIIYSYMAIEAFINQRLNWFLKMEITERKYLLIDYEELKKFQEKYKEVVDYNVFKSKGLSQLKDRINKLCVIAGIAKICDSNPDLWENFNNLLAEYRHHLTHSNPSKEHFNIKAKEILQVKKLPQYSEIASNIIGHFFDKAGSERGKHLKENVLF